MRPTGIAQLSLHGGKAPAWLCLRMVKLGREITRLRRKGPAHNTFLKINHTAEL
ncbi:MAG: DUF763 domain-containing protein [Deltaproteobacteria bacterium]|nr:DUF763 domain-containing protein [Deltaproteobacteria bacterium]